MITPELRKRAEEMMLTECISRTEWCALVTSLIAAAEPPADFGLPVSQEPKYTVNDRGRIVNRATGKPIPDDEPIMVFRAQDVNAAPTGLQYAYKCVNPAHHKVVMERVRQFEAFALANPDRMKQPD